MATAAPPLQHAVMAAAAAAAHDAAWASAKLANAPSAAAARVLRDAAGSAEPPNAWEEGARDAAGAAGAAALCAHVAALRELHAHQHRAPGGGGGGNDVDATCLNGALLALVGAGRPLAALAAAHALALDFPNAPDHPSRRRLTDRRRSRTTAAASDDRGDDLGGGGGDGAAASGAAELFPVYAVRPNLGTYHAAMRAAVGCGEPDLALAVLADLKAACDRGRAADLAPNAETHALAAAAVRAREQLGAAQPLAK